MYTAAIIARYIISYCKQNNISISNLKLQKLLYFVWIEFFKNTGQKLFEDTFYAWPLGPVIPSIYFEYCAFGGLPIDLTFEDKLNLDIETDTISKDDLEILDNILQHLSPISVRTLVDKSHRKNGAWDCIYSKFGRNSLIPTSDIIQKECSVE